MESLDFEEVVIDGGGAADGALGATPTSEGEKTTRVIEIIDHSLYQLESLCHALGRSRIGALLGGLRLLLRIVRS